MDESGDLGFTKSKRNSKYFIITFLFAINKKPLDKIVKKIFTGLKKNTIKVSGGILHATKEKSATIMKLLKLCASCPGVHVMTMYLNKSKVYTTLQDEKHLLYNYTVNILIDRILTKKLVPIHQPIEFIASRRETSKILNNNFVSYVKNKTKEHIVNMKYFIKTPQQEKGLQVVDFICWAIYQKYEKDDSRYYNNIKSIVIEEKGLFT